MVVTALMTVTSSVAFLGPKGDQRTAAGAREELHRSLDRLGVDHVDLWQLHSLADPIEWDIALSPGGALEAAIEAREQGLIRWIGVTGHGSQIAATHRRSLERFGFDSVLLPYNFITMQNPYHAGDFNALYETCRERRREPARAPHRADPYPAPVRSDMTQGTVKWFNAEKATASSPAPMDRTSSCTTTVRCAPRFGEWAGRVDTWRGGRAWSLSRSVVMSGSRSGPRWLMALADCNAAEMLGAPDA